MARDGHRGAAEVKRTWRDWLAYCLLAASGLAVTWILISHRVAPQVPPLPATAAPAPDASGATGRAGALQWEIYAEDPELGRVPVQVWVHGPGWAVRCEVRPPGSVPASGCVTVKEPARVERSGR